MKNLPAAAQPFRLAQPFALHLLFGVVLLVGAAACDDSGTTTSCDDMPLIERHGEGGAVDPTSDPDYERWRAAAIREGCATPSGKPEDFNR